MVVALVAWFLGRPDTYTARPPRTSVVEADPTGAAQALRSLQRAVVSRDPDAARALAPAGDRASADLLAAVVSNARALRVRDFTLRYVDELGAPSPSGAWPAAIAVTWRFAGFDPRPAGTEVGFTFDSEDGAVALVGIGAQEQSDGLRAPLWLTGPVAVRRTPQTLVLASAARAADRFATLARHAVPVVERVVTTWARPRLVLEVPSTERAVAAELGAATEEYDNVAAVTASVDGSLSPRSPVHVFVNPAVLGRLRPTGAQIVISHEATHVALGAARSTMPLWLLEGFADFVALREVDLPPSKTAGQIIAQVRRDGPPSHLPGQTEFDSTDSSFGTAYESAWQACVVLADRGGQTRLLRLYRLVDGGTEIGKALRQEFGWSIADLTRAWQLRLSDLAG